jgi:hypothetical protein
MVPSAWWRGGVLSLGGLSTWQQNKQTTFMDDRLVHSFTLVLKFWTLPEIEVCAPKKGLLKCYPTGYQRIFILFFFIYCCYMFRGFQASDWHSPHLAWCMHNLFLITWQRMVTEFSSMKRRVICFFIHLQKGYEIFHPFTWGPMGYV